ncbi:hypothetical protein Uis1B_2254 [Bifidobacterium margollesii]|uniref:Uncharacterized protein n=1 Tax=Bifidobacterium margollesii TaxID=2020964 RepID=A0A2N5J6S2_9BIFI|nr:hypothetical protein [Bifidobacterium margollesii]PLS29911.1 hypothetical protein Uis1B_2254 [Bifidobacterium margollesii]
MRTTGSYWLLGRLARDPVDRTVGRGQTITVVSLDVAMPDGTSLAVEVHARGRHRDWLARRRPVRGDMIVVRGEGASRADGSLVLRADLIALDPSVSPATTTPGAVSRTETTP